MTAKQYRTREVRKHQLDVDGSIRYLMAAKNLTRAQIARASGVSRDTLDKIRIGWATSTDTIVKLADAFGYDPLDFLSLSKEKWVKVAIK